MLLSPFTRRSGSMPLHHAETALHRRLEPGEHVVLYDRATGEHLTAVVADVADDCYRLRVGTRITATEAASRVVPAAPSCEGWLSTGDIVALLAAARRAERDIAAALAELEGGDRADLRTASTT